jgi:hypothetical protein
MGMITKTQAAKIMGIPVDRFKYFWDDEWRKSEEFRMFRVYGKISREYFMEWWNNRGLKAPPFVIPKNDQPDRIYVHFQETPEFQKVRKNLISAGWLEANDGTFSYYFRGKNTLMLWGYHIDRYYDEDVIDRGGNSSYFIKGPVWNYRKSNDFIPDFAYPGHAFTYIWNKIKDKKRPSTGNQTFEEWAFAPATEKP